MSLTKQEFTQYVQEFRFKDLFVDIGWNRDRTNPSAVSIGKESFTLTPIAEKQGFRILLCAPQTDGRIPDYATRKQIHTRVVKFYQEHFIIYTDARQHEQLWQVPVRRAGQPLRIVETRWNKTQAPELLYQRAVGLFIALDEEGNITIVDIRQRVAANFEQNAEKVTKKFYDGFKREHTAFLKFIKGIEGQVNQDWYASLMLNRLMFCYFIQKKGFLNGELDYLKTQLNQCQEKRGENQFYTFYRDFLLVLFHQGLGAPGRDTALANEIGTVPYLNGGFFDKHQLEEDYPNITIDDKAFEDLFTFFDEWNWHLDDRTKADGKQINPDVIGYIFERYINDRAGMGAYYTKEDITDYIGKNCLIPYLFDETQRRYPAAFTNAFDELKKSGNAYIYDAVKHGISQSSVASLGNATLADTVADGLPANIVQGLDPNQPDLLDKRSGWNRTAPAEVALPTETWREVVDRRKRYADVMAHLADGSVATINDFITYNLNIRVFAQVVLEDTADPKLILHFYQVLESVSVLDPTCGSGAFLFAALNILEPLYETCLMRMQAFTGDEDETNRNNPKVFRNDYKEFRQILEHVRNPQHPNLRYFIYKSIILNNLYGVDIMREATEIAKLRLFLKLVATVDADYDAPNMGLEPLPDVDFNIRAGNTLIGFATEGELDRGLQYTIEGVVAKPGIEEKMELVSMAFERYKTIQLEHGQDDYADLRQAKHDLRDRLKALNESLNNLMHKQYASLKFADWCSSHKPFHWLAEFYEIVKGRGGFDVIIGNPPYIDFKVGFEYNVSSSYLTYPTRNLYAVALERCSKIARYSQGYIVPISSTATEGFVSLQNILLKKSLYVSTYDDRPSHLFEGLDKNTLSIILIQQPPKSGPKVFATSLNKWNSTARMSLFENIQYTTGFKSGMPGCIPKVGSEFGKTVWNKLFEKKSRLALFYNKSSSHNCYTSRKVNSFLQVLNFIPEVYDGQGKQRAPSELKELKFDQNFQSKVAFGLLNSSLFRWFVDTTADGSHLNKREIDSFPVDMHQQYQEWQNLLPLTNALSENLQKTSEMRTMNYKHDSLTVQCIIPKRSKSIIDEIDKMLAKHYGFTNEELDFIINYDIKYRMGREAEDGDE